ncbi:MAG TPA: GAF and ANTAR domain-containing protein [Nocardioidaceae bacterium]|nr:GAF and ANTAR domain-containing protein [Nocardioidaceae bacterium]
MSERESFARHLAAAARSMQGETGTQETLDKAVAIAVELIEGCDLAGISIVHRDDIDTSAGSDESLRRIDELQFAMGEGPCLDALKEHETVHSPDLAHDDRWPKWGPKIAKEIGVRSNVSYRLFTTADTLGAMNLYSRQVEAFDADDIYSGLALAAHIAVALAGAQNAEHLERAISNRTVIGQAEGILMERFNLTAEQAFGVLRRMSSQRNVKLSMIAEELVRTRQIPGASGK